MGSSKPKERSPEQVEFFAKLNNSRKPTPRLRSSKLEGKLIEVQFRLPLEEAQKKEVSEKIRPLLSNKESRIRFTSNTVVVEGVLVRDSKPVRDVLLRYRESICPKPIRRRIPES